MNQITTQYVTENGACYEQYVITDPAAKTSLTITPERGGMITGFSLNGEEYIWTPTAASTTLTARLTPWRPMASRTCADGTWRASAPTA